MNSETSIPEAAPRPSGKAIAAVLLALTAIAIAFHFLPMTRWIEAYRAFILDLGWTGRLLYVGAYIIAAILLVPCTALTFLGASAFGLFEGYLLALAGSNLGALCAFLLTRGVMRQRVELWAGAHPRFSRVDDTVSQRGLYIVLLLRLTPVVPYTLLNYFLGLTRVSIWRYALGTLLGMLPVTFAVAYMGSLSAQLAGGVQDRVRFTLYGVGFLATIAATILITRLAKKALRETEVGAREKANV